MVHKAISQLTQNYIARVHLKAVLKNIAETDVSPEAYTEFETAALKMLDELKKLEGAENNTSNM